MNYIGSKYKLSDFISSSVKSIVGEDLSDKIFCDLFAGTGVVGRNFKKEVKKVISNDMEFYSYVLNKNYIENHEFLDNEIYIKELNETNGEEGFIFNEYSENGKANRLYFSEHNGKKIDAIRTKIEFWKTEKKISSALYYFLLASLLESADKVANTASVYGAFLKKIKKTAQKELILEPAIFEINSHSHEVYNEDSNLLIKKIEGDILYLDPPYNHRRYNTNYHILETVALYDNPQIKGKTGIRVEDKSSKYCSKKEALIAFEDLIRNANFKFILLSYNDEGIISSEDIKKTMLKYGKYSRKEKEYKRFKADNNRTYKKNLVLEYIHCLEKV